MSSKIRVGNLQYTIGKKNMMGEFATDKHSRLTGIFAVPQWAKGKYAVCILCIILFSSCSKIFIDADVANNPKSNFDYLWNDIHNRYSFLDYKNIDWNKVYDTLAPKIHNGMPNEDLFDVLETMLNTLRDGHVNLTSPFNESNYYPIFLGSPQNYDGRLVLENYLLRDPAQYYITGNLLNTIIDTLGVRVGYIRYSSFINTISSYDISYVINRFLVDSVDGVIIDVRNNGGGDVGNIFPLVNHFADEKRLAYFSQIKAGPGINDFYDDEEVYMQPASTAYQFTGRIAVLTNRSSYSATSLFSLAMKQIPYVKLIGDSTGGGLGAPTFAELPNGWTYRFSVTRTLSPDGDNWENGIPADILIDLDPALQDQGYDSIIERAIQYIITGN
ncbi:MAG: S41 family peptidase [Chitinophagales bacterium]